VKKREPKNTKKPQQ